MIHRIASHRIAPLAAAAGIADALNHGGHQQAGTRRLVEKTPDNEHHFDRLVDAFPGARFLHILREPEQNLRSLMKLHEVRERAHREDWLRDSIAQSHEAAGQNVKALGADRYRIVRYEGITEHAREGMQSIAEWLGVLWSQSLTTPTVLGIPAASNSMWKRRQVVGKVIANQHAGPATSV